MAARRVALVTGGARGIGAAIARALAAAGWAVAVNYRQDAEGAAAVVAAIATASGEAASFQADIADATARERLVAAVTARFGRIDGLVNNAAFTPPRTPFLDLTPDDIARTLDTDLAAPLALTRIAARRMAQSRGGQGGAVVNIVSEAGRFGGDRIAAYAAAKAGLIGLTLALGRELAPEGIRVNAVSPGMVDTGVNPPAPEVARGLPLGRAASVDEIAAAVVWLMSDQAAYVAGAVVPVAGGR